MITRLFIIVGCLLFLVGCINAGAYYRTLTPSQQVSEIQSDLKKLGYYSGNIDGINGTNTEQAIRNFQRDRRMVQDGQVSESVYIQAGLAVTEQRQNKSKTRVTNTATQTPRSFSSNTTSPNVTSTNPQQDVNRACSTADWSGVVKNIADLFECDTARAIETLSAGRKINFKVMNLAFSDNTYIASMNEVTSYSQAAQEANNKKGNFSWNNYFDTIQGYGSPYIVKCIIKLNNGSSLKEGSVMQVNAKLLNYAERTVTLTCS